MTEKITPDKELQERLKKDLMARLRELLLPIQEVLKNPGLKNLHPSKLSTERKDKLH